MLQHRDVLTPREIELIEAMPMRTVGFAPGQDIVVQGTRPSESCLVLKGFAGRSQTLREGQRQITALHVSGDFVDLHGYLLRVMDHSVVAIGPCEVGFVSHREIRAITETTHHLTRMFWLSTVIDGAIQRTWITCLGRRSAEQHMAHLFCELYIRLEAAGVASGLAFDFPMTQTQLGDVLGLSVVHVNRKLQELRASGLLTWQGGRIVMLDMKGLAALAEFDPTYLSLRQEPR
jgi:CRP-like cAMP-binding protein